MKLEKDKKWKWPAENMREWTDEELAEAGDDFGGRLLRLRFQYAGGQTDVLETMRQLKHGIAKVKTIQRERTLGLRGQEKV
jgi:large subunit ribosomal protein L29